MLLTIKIERVCYAKPTTKGGYFCILATDKGTAKGFMTREPKQGEQYDMHGEWETYRGEKQFSWKTADPHVPSNPLAMLNYVCELAPGVGPATEKLILAEFGEDWQKAVIDGRMAQLIGHRWGGFCEGLGIVERNAGEAKVVAWCLDKGLSRKLAEQAYRQWNSQTVQVIEDNLYALTELDGVGFHRADELRQAFGIGERDERRISAAILYALGELCKDGSTLIGWRELFLKTAELLGTRCEAEMMSAFAKLFETRLLVGYRDRTLVCLPAYETAESDIWEYANECT